MAPERGGGADLVVVGLQESTYNADAAALEALIERYRDARGADEAALRATVSEHAARGDHRRAHTKGEAWVGRIAAPASAAADSRPALAARCATSTARRTS